MDRGEQLNILRNADILVPLEEGWAVSAGGLLLFGRQPQRRLSLEKIRYGNSAPRNLFILKYLDNLRYVDGLGRGIPMILREMRDRARFEEIGELFVLTLAY